MRRGRRLLAALLILCATAAGTAIVATPAAAIVGGTVTPYQNYPYFVRIDYQNAQGKGTCGGSIIAPDWVLTAAHCIVPGSSYDVYTCVPGFCGYWTPQNIVPHPLWDGDHSHGHDLALLQKTPGFFIGNKAVAQLGAPWDPGAYAAGTPATIMGTGKTSSGQATAGTDLRVANTNLVSDDQMDSIFNPLLVDDNWMESLMIGAGTPSKNICHGDSGSPLVVNRFGRTVQVGVASFIYTSWFDDGCDNPSGYMEMSGAQLAWIASMVPSVIAGWRGCPAPGGVPGTPVVRYTTTPLAGQARDGLNYWSIGCVPQVPTVEVAHRSTDGLLWELTGSDDLRMAANGLGVEPGTTPAVASLPGGKRMLAFHAWGLHTLWYVDGNNVGHDTGIKLAPGSSPAIVAWSDGGYRIAYVNAADGLLWQLPPAGGPYLGGAGFGVAPGTSPAATYIPGVGPRLAFHAAGWNTLVYVDANNVGHNTGIAMGTGVSPAMAAMPGGGVEYAFGGGLLNVVGPDMVVHSIPGVYVADGTTPAIAAQPYGSYQVAVTTGQSSGGTLWTVADGVASNTGGYPQPGTSPAIVALPYGGFEMAYVRTVTGHIWYVGPDGAGRDTGVTSTGGSSPSMVPARVGPIDGLAGKCVDVWGGNPANSSPVQLFTCNGTLAQEWVFGVDSSIRALGKCLDVQNQSTTAGTKVQLWDCNGTAAQVWQRTLGNQLRNPNSNMCLDVPGASTADWTQLQIWPCNAGVNQLWYATY